MRPPLFIFVLIGLSTADNAWKPGTKYTYGIRGRTLTGIHQVQDQYTGMIIRGNVTVMVTTENQLTIQANNIDYADINRNLSQGWATDIPDEEVEYKPSGLQDTPFQLHIKNGVVDKMVVEKNLPLWQVNALKSIASQFQVDTQAVNLKHSKLNDVPHGNQQSGVYKTKEDSVNGIYETLYEIYPMPDYVMQSMPKLVPFPHLRGNGQIYNIEKSRNFSNSAYHMVYRYGMNGHEGWSEGTNQMGNMLARSSNSRIVISGDLKNYTIQHSETNEKVLVAPHMANSQKGIIVSSLAMTLQSVESWQGKPPSMTSPRTIDNLVYEYQQGEPQNGDLNERGRSTSSSSSSSSSSEHSDSSSSSSEEMLRPSVKRQSLSAEWINPRQKPRKSTENMMVENQSSSYSSSSSSSSSSSGDSSISSSEEYLASQPKINESPNVEFLPDNMVESGSEKEKVVEKIMQVAKKIGQTVIHPSKILEENILTSFSILTRLISGANTQQLKQAAEKLYYHESSSENEEDYPNIQNRQAWTAFRDALSQAGTGPALVTIKNMIDSKKLKGEDAASVVAVLSTSARYPTTEYMEYFFEMMKSEVVQSQKGLNTSAIIAFTDLVRRSQVDRQTSQHRYPIHLSGPQSANHRALVPEKYIPYFQRKLNSSISQGDSIKTQVYIRALGNMAHRKVLAVFEPYLEGKYPVSIFQRLVIVASLDEMTKVYPNTARSVLYRIYQNQGESPEVRVAAVMQLMKTNPAQLLQRMAEQTNYDRSKHVNAAVKSAIESAANGENDQNPEMIHSARSAANFLNPENYEAHYCKHFIWSFIEEETNRLGHQHNLLSIQGPDGDYPSSFLYNLQSKIGGHLREPKTISVMTSSSEHLKNYLLKSLQQKGGKQRPEKKTSDYTYQKIYEILNGLPEVRKQVEGNIQVSLFGAKRFFTFDNHTIEQLPEVLVNIQKTLQKGVNHHQIKYSNEETVEIGFPLAMGLRFTYSYSSPSLNYFGFKGKGEFKQETEDNSQFPQQVQLEGQYQYLQTDQRRAKIAFVFGQQRYVAGFERVAQLNIPLQGSIKLDAGQNSLNASLKPMSESNELQKLFEYRTDVYTTHHNINDVRPYLNGPNVNKLQSDSKKKTHKTIGKEQTGYAIEVVHESELNFMDLVNKHKNLNHMPTDIIKLMTQVDESIGSHYLIIGYNPQKSSSQVINISLSYKSSDSHESGQQLRKSGRSLIYNLRNKEARREMRNTTQSSSGESRTEELLRNVNSGIQDGKAHVLDASISFGTNKNRGLYSVTVAHAESPVSEQSRYYLHYTGIPVQESGGAKHSKVAVELNIKKPFVSLLNYKDAINVNPSTQIEGKINFGTSEDSTVTIQGKMERSERRKQYVLSHPLSVLCVEQMKQGQYLQSPCQNVTLSAGYLDKYELKFNYKNVPKEVQKAAYSLYSLARHVTYGYNTENVIDVQNPEGEMKLTLQWSEDLKHLNLSAQTPNMKTDFENMRMSDWVVPFLVQHPRYSQLRQISHYVLNRPLEGMCTLDTTNVTTFNNKTYPVNLGDCNHVLAMYSPHVSYEDQQNSQQYSQHNDYNKYFAILVKENQSRKKVVKIILGDEVVTLEPSSSNSVTVSSNGKTIHVSETSIAKWKEGEQQLEAYVEPGTNNLVLQSTKHGIEVSYDGHHSKVLIPSSYRNHVRGLCGTFDGEEVNDFTSPKNCVLRNHHEFTASYAIADSSCQGPAMELHRQAQNAPCYPKDDLSGDVVSDVEAGRGGNLGPKGEKTNKGKTDKSRQGCTNHKVRIAETEGKTCFSIKPQITCNANCKSEGAIEKTIEFHCLNESSATRHWVTMVKKGANPDFSQKKSNHQMSIRLPEKCVPNL